MYADMQVHIVTSSLNDSPLHAGIVERAKKAAWKMARYIPAVRNKIDRELKRLNESFEEEAINRTKALPYITSLPSKGIDLDEILKLVESSVYLGKHFLHWFC
jgi:hypothetical protein